MLQVNLLTISCNLLTISCRPSYKASRALTFLSRKRRVSGKTRPLQGTTTSEGDMAQADEMGDEGEGHSDDGFVEGSEGNGGRRRIKKRQGIYNMDEWMDKWTNE